MKKHFLISLLWLIMIFVLFGSSFPYITSFSNISTNKSSSSQTSNFNNEEVNAIEEYSTSEDYFDWTIEQISMGSETSAVVFNDGTGEDGDHLYTWGKNDKGQLGLGNKKNYNTPQEVVGLPSGNIEQISMGHDHGGAIVDGSLYVWGNNDHFQLGAGENSKNYPTPFLLPDTENFVNENIEQISMGTSFSMAVVNETDENDALYTWGENDYGQLGLGNRNITKTPKKVQNLPAGDIEQITGSKYDYLQDNDDQRSFAGAVINNGENDELYTWGNNFYGKLGLGEKEEYNQGRESYFTTPQLVTDLPDGNIEQISIGYDHSAAVVNDGSGDHLYTWGWNVFGQLGLGDNYAFNVPTIVTDLPEGDIEQISMSQNVSSAIVDGVLYAWGENRFYQLGNSSSENDQDIPTIVPIPKEGNQKQVSMVSIGTNHSAAVANNELYTWGENDKGQLGLGNTTDHYFPEIVEYNFPYLKEIKSWTTISKEESEVTINYSFKTNVDVQNVTISIAKESELNNVLCSKKSIPVLSKDPTNLDYWTGEATFDISTYDSYQYWIDLKYKDENGNIKTINNITEDHFNFIGEVVTPEIDKKEETEVNEIDPKTASIDYVVMGGTDSKGNEVTLDEVQWINTENGSEEVLVSNDDSPKMEDTLTANNLTSNHPYETKLVSIFNKDQSNETIVESSPIYFTTLSAYKPTTVSADEVDVINSTKASIYYEVDLGKNDDGENVKITSVDWIVEGKSVSSSKKAKGNLTSNNFETNKTYSDTTIEVTVSDGPPIEPFKVKEFQMDPGNTSSTIKQKEETEVEVISSTTATVEYEVELGTDVWGDKVDILKVEWIVEGKSVVCSNSEELTGKLTYDDFSPKTNYKNTTLELTVSDHSTTEVAKVNEFEMNPAEVVKPKIITTDLNYESTSAWINYEINPGNDDYGKAYKIESVAWMDVSEENPFYNSIPITNGKSTGKLEIEGLEPKSEIEKSLIVVTFEDSSIENLTSEIDSFTTNKLPEEKPTMKLTNGEITETSITINYAATLGIDGQGLEYKLTKIEVKDSKENSIYIDEDKNGLDENGIITINNLKSKTTYDDLIVFSTFEDSQGQNYESPIETNISSFKTLKEIKIIKTWMIITVSITTFLFVLNIFRGLIYLFLKNKSTKI